MGAPWSPITFSIIAAFPFNPGVSWVASFCWFTLLWVSTRLLMCSHYHLKVLPHGPWSLQSMLATGICVLDLVHCGWSLSAVVRRWSLRLCSDDTDTSADTPESVLLRLDSLWPHPDSHLPLGRSVYLQLTSALVSLPLTDLMSLPEVLATRINQ